LPQPFPTHHIGNPGIKSDQIDNIRPWRWWQPFVVTRTEGSPLRSLAFPFDFRRGKQIHLPSPAYSSSVAGDENRPPNYMLGCGLPMNSGMGNAKLTIDWFGRYRYIEKAV